jgi:DUF1680 family protein
MKGLPFKQQQQLLHVTKQNRRLLKCNRLLWCITLFICTIIIRNEVQAQEALYPNTFPLKDVTLLKGPFQHARDLNIQTLLQYDVDRLFAPFRKEAGLSAKASGYRNWEGLDGHVGGHYLTAMALNYAASGNQECKRRMEYIMSELKACQEASKVNNPDWGVGYLGGVPNSKQIWTKLSTGDFSAFRAAWVPWYNLHKMYAGLRDAWVYTGSAEAKDIFLKFCDWAINITSGLSDAQMQSMLDIEHGGMNEIFADAYQMTNDRKYLDAAKRFSHKMLLDAMAARNDNLDNKHANTQVPKAIGFQRIAEAGGDHTFEKAGSFFWETVTGHRSLAFGGNSRREFFPSVAACTDFVSDVEGPESCNSYNMLRLTEGLFRMNPSAMYADYYERTIYNHILSTQHPVHGGYVYFTPARPRHYRVYSAPNQGMWCCVGSGMENHGKYNQFIYTHNHDSLFLNLFIASELDWKAKGVKLRQETNFPYKEDTKLTITQGSSSFTLMIRYPSWVSPGALKVNVNGQRVPYTTGPSSFVAVKRLWKKGDIVTVALPMHNSIEYMPNVSSYVAIMHGPILLGAKTGTEELRGLVADDSRWGHIAGGKRLPIDQAPIIVDDNAASITSKLVPVKGKPLTFAVSKLSISNTDKAKPLVLEPFYQIHDARYMMYWMVLSKSQYRSFKDSLGEIEKQKIALHQRTVDFVAPGEQQPEADHAIQSSNSRTGNNMDEFWREANNEGFFSYSLSTNKETDLSLMVRYWGRDQGNRSFDIYIDNEKLETVNNTRKWQEAKFQNIEYIIPAAMLQGKERIRVKFQALPGNIAGAVYYIRLLKKNKPE